MHTRTFYSFALTLVCCALTSFVQTALADEPSTDPSTWKCSQCPFLQGYETQTEVGTLYANGANATFGRYSGIDHSGPHLDASASGQTRSSDGSYANYDLERLGLAAREGYVEGGREGQYDLRISYDGQPQRLYETGTTPYQANGSTLTLGSSFKPVKIESDRRTVALLGRYFASPSWTVYGEFRREEHDGTGLTSASFLTEAVQLPQPFYYVTNSFETGVAWSGSKASFRLNYIGSWFEDDADSTTFDNPYAPIVPGSTQGQLSLAPSNTLQQMNAAGNLQLPWASTLTYGASLGTLKQNSNFLPVSTLPGQAPLQPGSLEGDVHLSHYALGLASRPLSKLSLRGNAVYDGRDDKTNPLEVAYIVADTFPGGTAITPRYSQDHVRLDGAADYALAHWIRGGVAGKLDEIHYGPGQPVTWTQNAQSWVHATITPVAPVSFTGKYGNALRKVSSFDAEALPIEENSLVRDYNYAPRDRVFSSFTGAWSVSSTLTWSLEESLAKDDYRSSPLGLENTHEQRVSSTVTWSPRETLSAYVDAGYEKISNLQKGSTGIDTTPWLAGDSDRFWNLGAGGRWVPQARWVLTLDYILAPSYDNSDTMVGGLSQAFPQSWTKLDSTRFAVAYQWTEAARVHLRYTREQYNSSDWALNGVGPSTVPNLLALGLQPYRDNVNMFALTVQYNFGRDTTPVQATK